MTKRKISLSALSVFFLVLFPTTYLWANDEVGFCHVSETYEHIIITSEALKGDTTANSLSVFMQHRIDNGISSTIVSTDSIYHYYQGVDNQEKIRNFIKDAKAKWETKYVLLAGDVNIIPARMLYARGVNMASDMYYACLDNTFNDDGDDIWGELNDGLDFEYDVYVGRASAENLSEMHNFVYKTISYENSPLNASYHTKIIHMSQEANGIGDTEKWCDRYRAKSDDITFEYYRLTDAAADPVSNNRLSNGNIGQFLGASHGYVGKLANITIGEAIKFSNADQFYFMTSIACLSGRFEQDCVAEAFCTSTQKGGAFAGMFNSEDAFPPYIVQYLYKLRDVHFDNKVTKLGILRAEVAKTYAYSDYIKTDATAMARRYQAYQYNLFGDPATDLKTVMSTPVDVLLSCDSINDNLTSDHSGNDNHATIHGPIDTTQLLGSNALGLDGESNYLSIPHNLWNPMGNQLEMTLSGWFYIDSLMPKMGLFVKGMEERPFALYLKEDGHFLLELNKNTPDNAWKSLTWFSKTKLKAKGLYHLALVLEYKSLQGQLYVDGILKETFPLPSNYLLGSSNEPLYIGKDPQSTNGYFKGMIDDIEIYSKSMSALEINASITKEKPYWIEHISITDSVGLAYANELDDKADYTFDYNGVTQKPITVTTQTNNDKIFSGSIVYQLDSDTLIDNSASFSSYDKVNSLNTQLNKKGTHTLSIMLYTEKNGKGMLLDERIISINILESASLKNTNHAKTISIGPNPGKDHIWINSTTNIQDYSLSLFDASGRLICQNSIPLCNRHAVNISDLCSGVYLLKLENNNSCSTFNLIKE